MRKVALLPVVLVAAVTLAIPSAWAAKRGGTLIVGIHADAHTMDPSNHRDRETETIHRNMFDGLVVRDPDMVVRPQLAESWRVIDDTTVEFRLRKGVRWHNGDPFDARDVKFTIERIVKKGQLDGKTSPRRGLLGPVYKVSIVDRHRVRIHMKKSWPILLAMLPVIEMMPKAYTEKVGSRGFVKHPIGTGPFKFVEWKKGERVVMERFEEYYGGSSEIPPVGKAPIKRVIFKIIPETASRIAALRAGSVDIIDRVPPHAIPGLRRRPNITVAMANGTRSSFIEMNVTRKPFSDVRVRKAVNHALNVDLVIKTILGGLATRIPGVLSPQSFAFDPAMKPYRHDPALAKKLLAEAGYPDGFTVELDTVSYRKDVAEAYASQLAKVGIKARVRVWEYGVLKPKALRQERVMVMKDWGAASLMPDGIIIPKLKTKGRGNFSGYSNPEVDKGFAQATTTMDAKKRDKLFKEAHRIIHADAPMVFEYVVQEIYAHRNRVKNWRPSPDSRINLHDVWVE